MLHCVLLIPTHVCCPFSSLQLIPPPRLHLLSLQISVVCKQKGAQSRSLMQSHLETISLSSFISCPYTFTSQPLLTSSCSISFSSAYHILLTIFYYQCFVFVLLFIYFYFYLGGGEYQFNQLFKYRDTDAGRLCFTGGTITRHRNIENVGHRAGKMHVIFINVEQGLCRIGVTRINPL